VGTVLAYRAVGWWLDPDGRAWADGTGGGQGRALQRAV